MEQQTCPNCNVDVDADELRKSNLRCPTCGHDMSDTEEKDEFEDGDWEEEEEGEDFEEGDEEDEDEEEEEEKA